MAVDEAKQDISVAQRRGHLKVFERPDDDTVIAKVRTSANGGLMLVTSHPGLTDGDVVYLGNQGARRAYRVANLRPGQRSRDPGGIRVGDLMEVAD